MRVGRINKGRDQGKIRSGLSLSPDSRDQLEWEAGVDYKGTEPGLELNRQGKGKGKGRLLKMMSRQAYFYRVPPQELHRRNQADPAKARALQTVIDMKVGGPPVLQLHASTGAPGGCWNSNNLAAK